MRFINVAGDPISGAMPHLDLTEDEAAALIKELSDTICEKSS